MPPHHSSRVDMLDPNIELALRELLDEKMDPMKNAVIELKTLSALQAQTNASQAAINGQTKEWMGIHVREYHNAAAVARTEVVTKTSEGSTGRWLKRHPFLKVVLYGALTLVGGSLGGWVLTNVLPALASGLAQHAK